MRVVASHLSEIHLLLHNKYMDSNNEETGSKIVFFDLETDDRRVILEFGAIVLCPQKLVELDVFSTLVRPTHTSFDYNRRSGITQNAVAFAPTFGQIADRVYHILNGRIWVGHNIEGFDCLLIQEAFEEIGRQAPKPIRTIDSLRLLGETFRRRAGDKKLVTLANYFELGKQKHRSLADARMTLEVIKCCATIFYLEKPDHFDERSIIDQMDIPEANMEERPRLDAPGISLTAAVSEGSGPFVNFLDPDDVSIPCVSVSFPPSSRSNRGQVLHGDMPFQLYCRNLRVHFDISTRYDSVTFVVHPTPSLRHVLDVCDDRVFRTLLMKYDGSITPKPVVSRKYLDPTIRLRIPVVIVGGVTTYATEMYEKDASGNHQRLEFTRFDPYELNSKIVEGKLIDAYLSLEVYDFERQAGILLDAKKLIFDSMQ